MARTNDPPYFPFHTWAISPHVKKSTHNACKRTRATNWRKASEPPRAKLFRGGTRHCLVFLQTKNQSCCQFSTFLCHFDLIFLLWHGQCHVDYLIKHSLDLLQRQACHHVSFPKRRGYGVDFFAFSPRTGIFWVPVQFLSLHLVVCKHLVDGDKFF